MCTVTWVDQGGGYELLCNRDEKRNRAAALPARVRAANGVRFVAPADGDFGGTWIGANEFGMSLCLLNGKGRRAAGPMRSRGLLVLDLLGARNPEEVEERVRAGDLSLTAPFTLLALDLKSRARILAWDGCRIWKRPACPPLTSSSWNASAVAASRRDEFRRLMKRAGGPDARTLMAFHESHGRGPSACSPCMHRTGAETVSFSHVRVSGSGVEFFYSGEAPCRRAPARKVALHLRP